MANEIEMAARLYAAKGGASINSQTWTAVANMTGRDMGQQTQDVGNSWETLDTPTDLALPYKLLLVNLDQLNGIQMRFRDATTFPNYATPIQIPPGQFVFLPQIISGVELQLISTSGTVKVMTQYCEI